MESTDLGLNEETYLALPQRDFNRVIWYCHCETMPETVRVGKSGVWEDISQRGQKVLALKFPLLANNHMKFALMSMPPFLLGKVPRAPTFYTYNMLFHSLLECFGTITDHVRVLYVVIILTCYFQLFFACHF